MGGQDPAGPSSADTSISSLIPNEALRQSILSALAECIQGAHEQNPAGWDLTLNPNGQYLRLNVGRIFLFDIQKREISISAVRSSIPEALRQHVDPESHRMSSEGFKSLKGVSWYSFPPASFSDVWDQLRVGSFEAIQLAAKEVRRTPYFPSHSTGALKYVETATGYNLPRPNYHFTQQEIIELIDLVRVRYPNWEDFGHPAFVGDEIEYKRRAANTASELLGRDEFRRLIEEQDFRELVNRLKKIAQSTNLLFLGIPSRGDLSILHQENIDQSEFAHSLFDLLHGDNPTPERFQRYLDWIHERAYPSKWTFPTYYLFLLNPEEEMFVKPAVTSGFARRIRLGAEFSGEPTAEKYALIREVSHQLRESLAEPYGAHDMIDIQSLIYVSQTATAEDTSQGYWKVAPGEGAWQWDECREGNFIGIGWEEFGDVSGLSRKEFEGRMNELVPRHDDWTKTGARQLWVFAHRIKEGDRIVGNKGTKEVLGIGTVSGPYYFVPGVRHGHRLPVEWDDLIPRMKPDGEEKGWQRTVVELDREKFAQVLAWLARGEETLQESYPLERFADESGFPVSTLEKWVRAIERKGQAILYGPPGTGKTYVAERLARHLVGGGRGSIDLVQFHPAYAYEDFIQGIRPDTTEEGHLTYENTPGRFLEFCRKAEEVDDLCVLIIDEINRAHLSRVFGELMYLLEYREKNIPLAGGSRFEVPSNVRVIGTMNTADRSIALVDHALRRRFTFLRLQPDYGVLRRYHERQSTGFPIEGLVRALEKLNRDIADPHYEVGITFFLREDLRIQIEDIWRMEIEPYLEEHFFNQVDKVREHSWEKVHSMILPS